MEYIYFFSLTDEEMGFREVKLFVQAAELVPLFPGSMTLGPKALCA